MKKIFATLAVLASTATFASGPTHPLTESNDLTRTNYLAIEKLMVDSAIPIDRNYAILVSSIVDLNALNQSSALGRLISEQISTRLTQLGYNVAEMKLRNDIYISDNQGEFFLSRNIRELSKSYNTQAVVVGNYTQAAETLFITLKVVAVADNRVIGAVNYTLPVTPNTVSMLRDQVGIPLGNPGAVVSEKRQEARPRR
jgi:hypothetical protein